MKRRGGPGGRRRHRCHLVCREPQGVTFLQCGIPAYWMPQQRLVLTTSESYYFYFTVWAKIKDYLLFFSKINVRQWAKFNFLTILRGPYCSRFKMVIFQPGLGRVALLEGKKRKTEYSACLVGFFFLDLFVFRPKRKNTSSQSFAAAATSLKGGQKRKSLRWQNKQPGCGVVTDLQEISGLTSRTVLSKLTLSKKRSQWKKKRTDFPHFCGVWWAGRVTDCCCKSLLKLKPFIARLLEAKAGEFLSQGLTWQIHYFLLITLG